MSVVIIGGNECMKRNYIDTCKKYGYKAKIFSKSSGKLTKQIGNPDLMIIFTNTVSHKMVNSALDEAKRNKINTKRCNKSSICALNSILSTN